MIYEHRSSDAPLGQGDVFEECPLVYWTSGRDQEGTLKFQSSSSTERVIVLTQACDVANAKTSKVQVAVVHATAKLVSEGILKAQAIRDQVRRHLVFGWYFLPVDEDNPESIVDLHDIHTVPRELLEEQIQVDHRKSALSTPFREHLAQHFATPTTASRLAVRPRSGRSGSVGNALRGVPSRNDRRHLAVPGTPRHPRSAGTRFPTDHPREITPEAERACRALARGKMEREKTKPGQAKRNKE